MKRILVSNDDGIHAPGLRALVDRLDETGEVSVMAPMTEQSATSHSLTLHRPLRVRRMGERRFAVEGTPSDCVLLGVKRFLEHRPDLVVSGINQGPNMGEDVIYSGTVAAAMEGALIGIPSVSFSLATWEERDFAAAAEIANRVVARLLEMDLPPRFLVNVNVPPLAAEEIRGFRVTRLGRRVYNDAVIRKTDPRGHEYYWIGGGAPTWEPSPDTDFAAVEEGFVSLTPLRLDFTDDAGFEVLRQLEFSLA